MELNYGSARHLKVGDEIYYIDSFDKLQSKKITEIKCGSYRISIQMDDDEIFINTLTGDVPCHYTSATAALLKVYEKKQCEWEAIAKEIIALNRKRETLAQEAAAILESYCEIQNNEN